MRTIAAIVLCVLTARASEPTDAAGKILRPTDGAALQNNLADIVATAPSGNLQLDGQPLAADQPFPDVFHAVVKLSDGIHSLSLTWDGGKKEIRFYAGAHPPAGFSLFHSHPPLAGIECTQCHELNKRGRFRFKGGCFACHQQEAFARIHTHDAARLEQCGLCHNAHGSTVKSLLIYPKETACKICHN